MKCKKLIISPHVDDEILGCGGILDENSFVYYCGIDESKIVSDPKHRIGIKSRVAEIKKVTNYLMFKYEVNYDAKVNYYKISDFISKFEKLINDIKPEMIFIPSFQTYNQDHKVVYNAVKIALRPHDKNFFVKKVLVYEQPSSIMWENSPLIPNYFVPIDIDKKIKAYSFHKSQVRSMRSNDLLRAIVKIRGKQANCEHAEAFFIKRWVD